MLTPLARNSNDGGSSINFITQNIGHVNYFFFSNNIGTYSLSASAPLPLSYVIYGRLRGSGIAMSDQNEVNVPDEVLAHQVKVTHHVHWLKYLYYYQSEKF